MYLYHSLWFSSPMTYGDYFISKFPKDFIPPLDIDLDYDTGNYLYDVYCDESYEYCRYITGFNWVLYKLNTDFSPNTEYAATVEVPLLPLAIPLNDVTYETLVFGSNSYSGKIIHNITEWAWEEIVSYFYWEDFHLYNRAPLRANIVGRKKAEVIVAFYTDSDIPWFGSIEIVFPNDFPYIYPDCYSTVTYYDWDWSEIYGEGGEGGVIGCEVQNDRSWVITGFNDLYADDYISIYGYIDLPVTDTETESIKIYSYGN